MIDTVDFQVIGELKANPDQLLLRGDDGLFYSFDLISGQLLPLMPDQAWTVDILAQPLFESPVTAAASLR